MAFVFNMDFTKQPENEECSILSLSFNIAVHRAAESCDWHTLKTLLEISDSYYTLDSCAFDSLCRRLVDDLIFSSLPDEEGYYLIHRLAMNNDPLFFDGMGERLTIVSMLIEKKVDVNIEDPDGNTPIQLAAKQRQWGVFEMLLPFVEDVNKRDSEGFTLLHRLASSSLYFPGSSEYSYMDFYKHCTAILFEKGADIGFPCPSGENALHLAVKNHSWCMVTIFANMSQFTVDV